MKRWDRFLFLGLLIVSILFVFGCGDSTSSDNTPPTVSISQPLDGSEIDIGNSATITIIADDNKGVTKVEVCINDSLKATITSEPYTYNWGTSGYEAGAYAIVAKAFDKAGNHTNSEPVNVGLLRPNTPPAVPFNPFPAHNATNTSTLPTLSWECSDPEGDSLFYDVYFGSSLPLPTDPEVDNQTETTFTPANLELNTLYYWRIDAYDGKRKTPGYTWSFTTESPDNTPPTVTITQPVDGDEIIIGNTVTITINADDNKGVTKVEICVNDTLKTTLTAVPYTYNWGTNGHEAGEYSMVAKAYDKAGNDKNSEAVNVTLLLPDNTPPTVSIAQPVDGNEIIIGNTVTITINADDNKGVTKVEVCINDSLKATITSEPYTYNWGTSGYEAGAYAIVAKAFDKAGNYKNSEPVNVGLLRPNTPPAVPFNPFPANEATNVSTLPTLSWECIDPEGDVLVYDVYFGNSSVLPNEPEVDNQTGTTFTPNKLEFDTEYYWRIDAYDGLVKTVGTRWSFRTNLDENAPPNIPDYPTPADAEMGVTPAPRLTWDCTDPDGTGLVYDIYFGVEADPPLVEDIVIYDEYQTGQLEFGTMYYWRIVASDGINQTSGPVWSFKTNSRPPEPSNPSPADLAVGIENSVILTWDCPDADGDTLRYAVYFSTNTNPLLVSATQLGNSWEVNNLASATTYYWKIIAGDAFASTEGDVWSFTTNTAPDMPSQPSPAHQQEFVPVNIELAWYCIDQDGDPLTYDVYLGAGTLQLVAEGITEQTYLAENLTYDMTYNWRIKATDGSVIKSGPIWSFDTLEAPNEPPYMPVVSHPLDGEENLPTNTYLSWNCDDPNTGQPLMYDMYFGTSSTPPLVMENIADTLYTTPTLETSTQYYWKVVAKDGEFETSGDVNGFTTGITAGEWNLNIVGQVSVPYGIYGVDYQDGFIYGADRGTGVMIINVTNPNSPYINGSLNTPNFCYDVAFNNGIAYSVDLEWGMQISDVSNPIIPQYLGYGNTPGNSEGIWVDDNYAYVADTNMGLQIFDISDSANPVIVGTFDTDGSAHQVEVVGNYAFVADQENGVVVIDVSDVTSPTLATTIAVATQAVDVYALDGILYISCGDELKLYDISSPASPSPLGTCPIAGYAQSCYVKESIAVVAAGDGGVAIVDVSNPSNPLVMRQTTGQADQANSVKDVRYDDNYIYISNGESGLLVMRMFD